MRAPTKTSRGARTSESLVGARPQATADRFGPVYDRTRSRSRPVQGSDLGLLGHLEGIIHFNAEIAHCAFQLCMSKQQLNGTQVFRAPVDQ